MIQIIIAIIVTIHHIPAIMAIMTFVRNILKLYQLKAELKLISKEIDSGHDGPKQSIRIEKIKRKIYRLNSNPKYEKCYNCCHDNHDKISTPFIIFTNAKIGKFIATSDKIHLNDKKKDCCHYGDKRNNNSEMKSFKAYNQLRNSGSRLAPVISNNASNSSNRSNHWIPLFKLSTKSVTILALIIVLIL